MTPATYYHSLAEFFGLVRTLATIGGALGLGLVLNLLLLREYASSRPGRDKEN
jgi:hypothetical protein